MTTILPDEKKDLIKRLQSSVTSKQRLILIKEINKKESIAELTKRLKMPQPTVSKAVNSFKSYKLIEKIKEKDKSEVYDKVPLLKQINIDTWIKKQVPEEIEIESKLSKIAKKSISMDIEKAIKNVNLDSELLSDCFPLHKPYRSQIREAFLTLEIRMKTRLSLPEEKIGVELVNEAIKMGVFKRPLKSEQDGLQLLYKSVFLWFRNPPSHKKIEFEKIEAIELILFADYLLKLFEKLIKLNKILQT